MPNYTSFLVVGRIPIMMLWLESRSLSWPADWGLIFGREAPLVLEIGFGNGQFLLGLAASRPDHNLIGLEISRPSLQKAATKIASRQLTNVRLLSGAAHYSLWALFRPGQIQAVYINFPDPWPKKGHHHRRLLNDSFLQLLAARLPAGASLHIATDIAEYAQVIAETLTQSPYFESRLPTPYVTQDSNRLRTKYEQLALAAGRTCHYFTWQRNQTPAGEPFPLPPEFPMPHAVLACPLPLAAIRDQFAPFVQQDEQTIIRFAALYQASHDETLLVDTFVQEEPYSQRVALTIRPRPAGEIIITVHELGFPRPTAGLHQAIGYLAHWLTSLNPAIRLLNHNLDSLKASDEQ